MLTCATVTILFADAAIKNYFNNKTYLKRNNIRNLLLF